MAKKALAKWQKVCQVAKKTLAKWQKVCQVAKKTLDKWQIVCQVAKKARLERLHLSEMRVIIDKNENGGERP